MNQQLISQLKQLLSDHDQPRRPAWSSRYPRLKPLIIFIRQFIRSAANFFNQQINYQRSDNYFPAIIARHQSVLRRPLGTSDPRLQEGKIINLAQAVKSISGVIIEPGQIFSLWQIIGRPSRRKGYVDGMLLAGGQVVEGVGGGLCQLSNFLHWIFWHSPWEIIERYHHSLDVFPDSGRTLPFGSGATILYNFIDLKAKNVADQPLQIKLWLTDNHLKGQILSPQPLSPKFHVFATDHYLVKRDNRYFRYNQIYRQTMVAGKIIKTELAAINFAPVLYAIDSDYLHKNHLTVIDLSDKRA